MMPRKRKAPKDLSQFMRWEQQQFRVAEPKVCHNTLTNFQIREPSTQYIVQITVISLCNYYTCSSMFLKQTERMSRHLFLLLLVVATHLPLFAQVAIGQWRDHLPYNDGVQVADAGDWVFAAAGNGLFQFHKESQDVQRLSKVNGLSDIGFSAIAWSEENNTLMIAYNNTNIDLIQDGQIINIPDIKDKSILGNKTINKINIKDDFAYLACGFAIVVVDLVKHEVKDTYYIGPEGSVLNVHDVVTSDNEIFACTENGVYRANINDINLANFENWTLFSNLPAGTYNTGTWFNDRLYVNLSLDGVQDTVFRLRSTGDWESFDEASGDEVRYLENAHGRLLVVSSGSTVEFDGNHVRYRVIFEYGNGRFANPSHATMDSESTVWVADRFHGLVSQKSNLSTNVYGVNGPSSTSSTGMSIWDGRCYVASGSVTATWANGYNKNGLYSYKDNEWRNIGVYSFAETADFYDYLRVVVDPFDSKRVFFSSYGKGIVEMYDDEIVAIYDTLNSTLQDLDVAPGNIRCVGVQIDRRDGTLWVSSGGTTKLLYAKDAAGNWYGYNLPALGTVTLADIAIDDIGQKWIVAPRGVGLAVFNDGGTLGNTNDDQSKKLTQNAGNGNLASNEVFCVANDLDGEIWVGTNNGISVFYSPESVFGDGNFDSQQILIEQDGYVQYLLENESVAAIAVDGANRKWLGTANAGVFLMSADGTEQIFHFTTENSPLFSDQITSIGVDHLSGEVFIGTDKGIISYRGTATWGAPEFVNEDVYAFPNPVEPDYDGPVAIKGLVRDADVKITDAAGKVVFATTAEGGQAIWDGNKINGGRAQSGVYLVFASNEDGKETFVTKILFIN